MKDELGDRMKGYECVTESRLDTSIPIIARIDGRAFSALTRGCKRPFDPSVSRAMRDAAKYLVDHTHAKIGFVQSDEITLVWINEAGGSVFFDGRVLKMASVLASMAAVQFDRSFGSIKAPSFDCRVWNVPNKTEAANTVLWRALDARKNSVSSACRAHFSARKMHGQGQADMREMLSSVGIDFDTHYSADDRHGVFYRRVSGLREIDDETWAKIPEKHRPDERIAVRSWVESVDMPFFGEVTNREAVIFDGASPNVARI